MPRVGLVNSRGECVPWENLELLYDPKDWAMGNGGPAWPLPFLLAFKANDRGDDGFIHVSDLVNSPTRVVLQKREEYFSEPMSLVRMLDGTAFHSIVEMGSAESKACDAEVTASWDSPEGTIVGTIDSIVRLDGIVTDWKTMTGYGLKMCLRNGLEAEHPDYIQQVRYYVRLAARDPSISCLTPNLAKVFVKASDWQARNGVPRFWEFRVDCSPERDDKAMLGAVRDLKASMKILSHALEPCPDREAYGVARSGWPRRCESYCDVRAFCPFGQRIG